MAAQIIDTLNKIEPVVLNLSSLMVELNGLVKEARDAANGSVTYSQAEVDKMIADAVAAIPAAPAGSGFTQKQVDKQIADAIAALPVKEDTTPYSAEDLAKVEAAKDELIAGLEAQIVELKAALAAVPVGSGSDQEAAQEALADKMELLVKALRNMTPAKISAPIEQPELPVQGV